MVPTTRSVSIVLFGLLTLAVACGGNSTDSARNGGSNSLNGGGSGGQSAAGGSGGRSLGSGGRSSDGGVSAGGGSEPGGGLTSGQAGAYAGASTGGITGGVTSSGGNAGTGGRSTAGNTASSSTATGSGGSSAAGSTSSGGGQTGGSGGNTKVDGGGAEVGPGPDASVDTGRPDGPTDLPQNPDTAGNNTSLDACFADLPKPVDTQMVATKQASDGRVRIRIALDTEGRMGTSGSYGWGLIRLAIEVDGAVTCIKDRANLKYTGSHHNCSDKATATSGSTTYSLAAPDRSPMQITIDGGGAANGTWTLTDSTCTMAGSMALPSGCRSGGPC